MLRRKQTACIAAGVALCMALTACSGGQGAMAPVSDGDTQAREILPATHPIPEETIKNHRLIARNDSYSLYLNEQAVSIILRHNASGSLMESTVTEPDENDNLMWQNFTKSGVAIEYYPGTAMSTLRADMFLKSPQKEVVRTDSGFVAHIGYKELGISFDLHVTLEEDGLTAEVPQSSIRESADNKLACLYIFPFMGYTLLGEREGYMLIPDGCGALIDLVDYNGKYQQPYSSAVYGADLGVVEPAASLQKYNNQISTLREDTAATAPVFGMVHTDDAFGFLGVVERGQFNAEIVAYPNGAVTQYNWTTAPFYYRRQYMLPTSQTKGIPAVQKERETFDARIRYLFVEGEQADYSGLAAAYRRYLTDNGQLSPADASGGMRFDFFGGDVKKAAVGTSYVTMTTVDQLEGILQELADSGLSDYLVVYKAWQKGGAYGSVSDGPRVAPQLGGDKEFRRFMDRMADQGIPLFLYADFLRTYTKPSSKNDVIYRMNNRRLVATNSGFLHETNQFFTPLHMQKVLKKYDGIPLGLDGITNTLFSFQQQAGMISRQQNAALVCAAVEESGKKNAMTSPFDFLWKYTDRFMDFPVYGSDYKFVSREVPFFAMVLSGSMRLYSEYVNFQADRELFLLCLVEAGIYPSFILTQEPSSDLLGTDSDYLYATEYSVLSEVIQDWDSRLKDVYRAAAGGVVAHKREGDCAVSTYANGAKVYINFSRQAARIEDVMVEPMSFAVKTEGVS